MRYTSANLFARLQLLSALVFFASTPQASGQELRPLTAAELGAHVGELGPGVELLAARVELALAAVTAAGVLPNPSVALERESVDGSPEGFVRLALPLEISGRAGARVEAAEALLEAARAGGEQERLALVIEALAVYSDASSARLRASVLRGLVEALMERTREVRARAERGEASGYELGRLELELGTYQDHLAEVEVELSGARLVLAALMGSESELDPVDPLQVARPVAAEVLEVAALEARGDLRAAGHRIESARHQSSAGRRGWVPALELTGGIKTGEVGGETRIGYVAGIGLSLPVFDRGQAERERADAELRAAEAERRLLLRDVKLAVRVAHGALVRRIAQVERFEKEQLPRLDELVRRAEVSYGEGERSIFELLDAYRTAKELRLRHVELLRGAKQSALELQRAVGTRPDAGRTRPEGAR